MNADTGIPAPVRRWTTSVIRPRAPSTSSPPSVVISSRPSGTSMTICGRISDAMTTISSVAAISRFSLI
jgi:hypothetical protein